MNLFFWNPDPVAFTIPYFNHPVRWYGILFAAGFLISYFLLIYIFKRQISRAGKEHSKLTAGELSRTLVDHLLWYVVIATVLGARLGHILFYDFSYYMEHPLEIFKIWHGGLASHGAAIGIFIGLIIFYRRYKDLLPSEGFWGFMDLFVIPVPLAGAFIRMGNFINQEIVGTPSSAPWAVVFQHPADPVSVVPRHPVQLYEGVSYLGLFLVLFAIWRWAPKIPRGVLTGLFFAVLFSLRIALEFFKVRQFDTPLPLGLDMGQWLSIPFVLLGILLLVRPTVQRHA
jgi:phosphatidylglycerol:prolipoprotein diacylglycerol transferase